MADTFLILAGIGALLLCLLITVFLLLVYSGLFRRVEVGAGRPPIGDVTIAYKFNRGPYKEAGPYFTEVAKIAPDNKALSIYYDEPDVVPAHKLRYIVGSVLSEGGAPVDEEMKNKFEKEGYKILNLPYVTNVVKTTFPYISMLSIFIAISKVYPKLAAYIQEHKLCAHPCVEIYDGKNIHFMAPLARQDEFYVPETSQPDPSESINPDLGEEPSMTESLPDDSISYTEPSFSELSHSVSTDLTASTESKDDVVKMAAVQSGAGEAKNLADSGFSSDALAQSGSMKAEDGTGDTGSEGSSGSPFEDIKVETEALMQEMKELAPEEKK